MLQRWVDHEEVEHRVRDDFERNRVLIDLTAQPDDIKDACRTVVRDAVNKPHVGQVGIHFMKFCSKWNMQRLSDSAGDFAEILGKGIKESRMIGIE
jgi:hypothetical protein